MQLVYGSYTHDENEVSLASVRTSLYSDTRIKIGYTERWTINGRIQGSSQSDLTTKINALRAAYAVDGGNLYLKDNSGANTSLVILNSNTTSGVKIMEVSIPDLSGAQYTTFVDYTIIADAEVVAQTETYESYSDSISITGNGGPKRILMETATGVPIIQTVKQRTKVLAVQNGRASSRGSIPPYPQFLFPGLVQDSSQINKFMGVSVQNGVVVYEIGWNYVYESVSAVSAIPRLP